MKRTMALIPLLAIGLASAGQPLHDVLKLRTIEVVRCEAVTAESVLVVSTFARERSPEADGSGKFLADLANSVPGFLVEGVVLRQRDVTFPMLGSLEPANSGEWVDSGHSESLNFFVPAKDLDACAIFAQETRVNVVLSQRAECDTYPPIGICAFDYPIRSVDSATWAKYGE